MVPKQVSVNTTVKVPKQVSVPTTIRVPKQISVPKQIQVPKTIFVDVTTSEQYPASVTKVGTRNVTVPYQVTVPAYRLANRCSQTTRIVRRQIPVFSVKCQGGAASAPSGLQVYGPAIIDQAAARSILAQYDAAAQASA